MLIPNNYDKEALDCSLTISLLMRFCQMNFILTKDIRTNISKQKSHLVGHSQVYNRVNACRHIVSFELQL